MLFSGFLTKVGSDDGEENMNSIEKYVSVSDATEKKKPLPTKFIVSQYEIVQYFSKVDSKNEVIQGFLKFGGECFDNLAVFSVFSKSIQFLNGQGENIKNPGYVGSYSIDRNSVIRRVVVNEYPYRGNIPVGSDEKEVFNKYFNSYSEEVFLYPGNIRGEETDILFYSDSFRHNRESSIVTFEYIIEKTVLALKYLWVRKLLKSI